MNPMDLTVPCPTCRQPLQWHCHHPGCRWVQCPTPRCDVYLVDPDREVLQLRGGRIVTRPT